MIKIKRFHFVAGLSAACVLAIVLLGWRPFWEFWALRTYANVFDPADIDENFRTLWKDYPSVPVRKATKVFDMPKAIQALPQTVDIDAKQIHLPSWLEETQTTGFLVVKNGVIVSEDYYRGNRSDTTPILMSVTKSVVSILIGMAMESGLIRSIEDPVDLYAPILKEGGYAGVSLRNVLQMSSGIRWREDYDDLSSDVVRFAVAHLRGSTNKFVAKLPNEKPPGTFHHYASADTQVLAMVLEAVTGKRLAHYAEEKLWQPLGSEFDAHWLTDYEGMVLGAGGMNAALRDMAKLGLLYLYNGKNYLGQSLVSRNWVQSSVTADAPHLQPGKRASSDWVLGYGYQWWLPLNPDGDFCAIGIYGQFIYVYPKHNVVIVKTSAYRDYDNTGELMEIESLAVFRALAQAIQSEP